MNSIELIVLATTKVGENAVVVHTLSREYGRRGFLVRPGKKQAMALFLPLNILEADVVENPKSTLWSLRNILLKDGLSGIRGNLRVINDEVFGSDVLVHRDGIQAFAVGQVLAGGAGQLPDVLGHGFPQLGSPFLDQVLAVLVQVGEDAVGHVLVELVEPAAGEVHVVHFTGRDGGTHLIAGHVDDVDLHADLLAQDLVQLFQHHRVVLGRRAVALYPGQLHDVIRRGEGREAHHAQDHGQSENQRNQFLHTDSLL